MLHDQTIAGPTATTQALLREVRRTVVGMAAPEVHNDTDKRQYSLIEDGEVIGFAAYEVDGDEIRFVHTEVDPAHRGGGHASILVEHALDTRQYLPEEPVEVHLRQHLVGRLAAAVVPLVHRPPRALARDLPTYARAARHRNPCDSARRPQRS